jgi:hypothetical protein
MKYYFVIILSLFFTACLTEADLITDQPDRLAKPVIYSLVGNNNEILVYYTNSLLRNDTINFYFRGKEGIALKNNDKIYLADTTEKDTIDRVYNTTKSSNFKDLDKVEVSVDNHYGVCTIPTKLIIEPKFIIMEETPTSYIFVINLNPNNLDQLSYPSKIAIEEATFYNGVRIRASLRYQDKFFISGVANTFLQRLIDAESPSYLENNYTLTVPKNANSLTVPTVNFNFGNQYDFTGKLEFKISLITLDSNIEKYLIEEQNNARGIENPLATYSKPWGNITNAYGFCGCFNRSTATITY